MAGLVLDSSIALSWCLPDEDSPVVDHIQDAVSRHGAQLLTGRWKSPTLS